MSNRTRTRITIHTRQRIIVRPLPEGAVITCEPCGAEVLMVSMEKAADILATTLLSIAALMKADRLHAIETVTGSSLICCNSLAAAAAANEIKTEGDYK